MPRLFIAIRLPEPVLKALGDLSAELADLWDEDAVRWVKPQNMHLTLRFLGDAESHQLPELISGLDEIFQGVVGFDLRLAELGCFPNVRRPRVIWIGIQDEAGILENLQQLIEAMVGAQGWPKETRKFRPHLTLGHLRERASPPRQNWLLESRKLDFRVAAVELIESKLYPSGARYTTVSKSELD